MSDSATLAAPVGEGGKTRAGRLRMLAALYSQAVERDPTRVEAWHRLVSMLFSLGRKRELFAALETARAHFPDDIELRVMRAGAELRYGSLENAIAQARRLIAEHPQHRGAGTIYLTALKTAGQWQERYDAAMRMDWLVADPRELLDILGREVLGGRCETQRLLDCADAVLADDPAHTRAIYYKAICLARLERAKEASALFDLDRLVSIEALAVPAGFAGLAAFNAALAAEIRANPTLQHDPNLNSTRGGQQTAVLQQPGQVAVPALLGAIRNALDAYAGRTGLRGRAGAPAEVELQSWAVIYGSTGKQNPHLHPGGWLSGVYYVEAPRAADDARHCGDLLIGPVGKSVPGTPPWGVREVEPVPGRLVLFPSYTPHATAPSRQEGDRIVIAFDLVSLSPGTAQLPGEPAGQVIDALSADLPA